MAENNLKAAIAPKPDLTLVVLSPSIEAVDQRGSGGEVTQVGTFPTPMVRAHADAPRTQPAFRENPIHGRLA